MMHHLLVRLYSREGRVREKGGALIDQFQMARRYTDTTHRWRGERDVTSNVAKPSP